ncbi:MAG: hypothetical protein GTN89_16140 [Acidobacteria bacterium]|nr:hypothetical protein [Acidobacteriota bacterium]NIM62641.1 hypothetical protein [Acidobacteriota bacterium]NIO60759.1 hypothetical protein [Acidobacteriota bacterium]NIQ31830.1 hypothetical protein [Acidobacteriota bacterium]NIQ87157.1 hypothetical protein [Acidobacteriota bacterium]
MRRLGAIACCLACLAFGLVAGAPHVHEAGDHHDEMRGLHLDHTHPGEAPHGHHHGFHDHGHGESQTGVRHVEHNHGDAVYLTVVASRTVGSGPRDLPVTVSVVATVEDPVSRSARLCEQQECLRGPPQKRPTPSRAPPA